MTTSARNKARKSVRRRPRKLTPEKAVCVQLEDLLTAHHIRYFSNEVYDGPTRSGAWLKVGEPGMADYTAFLPAIDDLFRILHIEVKAEKGVQTAIQKLWQACEESANRHYIIYREPKDLLNWLESNGH